eukprot:108280-Lingulodinium_polyedra.AAC.1
MGTAREPSPSSHCSIAPANWVPSGPRGLSRSALISPARMISPGGGRYPCSAAGPRLAGPGE